MQNCLYGLGLRPKYYREVLEDRPQVDFYEIVSENYMGIGGKPLLFLDKVRADNEIAMHGVGLGIAGDELGPLYLKRLRELERRIEPVYVSDHLCWTSRRGHNSHDLLPVAYTKEVLRHVASRVNQVQELLGRRFYLENPTAYAAFAGSEMSEPEFFAELIARTGCGLLLDVNNVYVNSCNVGLDSNAYLELMRADDLCYFHLAGHTVTPDVRIDTHDEPVPEGVWELYAEMVRRFPSVASVIERDDNFPPFAELMAELDTARAKRVAALSPGAAPLALVASTPARNALPSLSWREQQEKFWALVTTPSSEFVAKLATVGNLLDDERFVSGARGARVYNDAYFLRLRDVIKQSFPSLAHTLGTRDFDELVSGYLAAHPPQGMSIKHVASELAAYLAKHPFASEFAIDIDAFVGLAALEWAICDLFDAEDGSSPLSQGVLAEITAEQWPSVRFEMTPVMRIVEASYEVGTVVDAVAACAEGEDPDLPLPQAGDYVYLVHRPDYDVEHVAISAREAAALRAVASSATFMEAATVLHEEGAPEEAAVQELVSYLVTWFERKLITGIALS